MEHPTIDQTSTLYSWANNVAMNALQCGLQTGHCVSEMFVQYPGNEVVKDWAENHKTIIIFKGGPSGSLRYIHRILQRYQEIVSRRYSVEIPVVKFNEDEFTMDGMLTTTAFILPNRFRQKTLPSAARISAEALYNRFESNASISEEYNAWNASMDFDSINSWLAQQTLAQT